MKIFYTVSDCLAVKPFAGGPCDACRFLYQILKWKYRLRQTPVLRLDGREFFNKVIELSGLLFLFIHKGIIVISNGDLYLWNNIKYYESGCQYVCKDCWKVALIQIIFHGSS